MSRLVEFYRLEKPDSEGRTLGEVWGWSIDELEQVHDFIQWMFPLDTPSAFNADAPLVTSADRQAFRDDPRLASAMRKSLGVFLHFLGLTIHANGTIEPGDHFNNRIDLWKYSNHNWLRITRVLKSLRLLGLESEAKAFWACLQRLHEDRGYISERSFEFYRDAMVD